MLFIHIIIFTIYNLAGIYLRSAQSHPPFKTTVGRARALEHFGRLSQMELEADLISALGLCEIRQVLVDISVFCCVLLVVFLGRGGRMRD